MVFMVFIRCSKAHVAANISKEGKAQWNSIVKCYKGQYGIHMDPRTTYLHCHELQYSDFSFVQGLL